MKLRLILKEDEERIVMTSIFRALDKGATPKSIRFILKSWNLKPPAGSVLQALIRNVKKEGTGSQYNFVKLIVQGKMNK